MDSYSENEDVQFFDTREDMDDSSSECSEDCCSSSGADDSVCDTFGYEFWTKNLTSVHERRQKFLNFTGLNLSQSPVARGGTGDACEELELGIERLMESSGTVLRTLEFDDGFSSNQSSLSRRSSEANELVENDYLNENIVHKIENLDDIRDPSGGIVDNNKIFDRSLEVGSNVSVTTRAPLKSVGLSPPNVRVRKVEKVKKSVGMKSKVKGGWLRRLGVAACIADMKGVEGFKPRGSNATKHRRVQRIRVHPRRKRSNELSSLFSGQEFHAHQGLILTMKFSADGQYLASAGEDTIVRVWKVIETERAQEFDILDIDSPGRYFTVNQYSKLVPLSLDKEKTKKSGTSSNLPCIVFPTKVFSLSEKPLHEFQGHSAEVLSLSWSNKAHLLSSSVDKTVRLWQVGCSQCLRVFSHNNYVTCVDFNPVDDNYFISGSIDGKVRIWEVLGSQVIDWIDIKEIVTAACYRPDGTGVIMGTMNGNCRLYNIIDNLLELDAEICLTGKKKTPGRRIVGFQFLPSDPRKVMVTSADSLVRMLSGVDVVCKFKGVTNARSLVSATFTSDGKHIVSASEDSNVRIWNYNWQDRKHSRKKEVSSCESFLSRNALIALPWCGVNSNGTASLTFAPATLAGDEFLVDSLPKGSATWPEEKLPVSASASTPAGFICKSEYKFLKSACQGMASSSHMWGLVIVTAGWDGWIRTYQNYGLPVHI